MSRRLYERVIPTEPPAPPGFAPKSDHGARSLARADSGIGPGASQERPKPQAQDQFRLQMAVALEKSGRGKENPMGSVSYFAGNDRLAQTTAGVPTHTRMGLNVGVGHGVNGSYHAQSYASATDLYEHKQQLARNTVDPNYGYQGEVVAPWLRWNEEQVSSNSASELIRPLPQAATGGGAGLTQNVTWASVTCGSQGVGTGIPLKSSSNEHMLRKTAADLTGGTGQIDVVTNFSLSPNRIAIGKAVFSHGCEISLVTDSDGGKPAFLLQFLAVGGVTTTDLARFTKSHTILAEEVKSITFFRSRTPESRRARTYFTIRARPTAQNGLIDYWIKELYSPDQPGSGASNFIVCEMEHEYDGGHRIGAFFDTLKRLPSFSNSFGQHHPDISLHDLGQSIGIDFKFGPISAFVRQDDIIKRGIGPILAFPVNKISIGSRVLSKTPRTELCQVSFVHGEGLPRIKISYQKKDKLKTHEIWHNSIAAVYGTTAALLDSPESCNYIIIKLTSPSDGGKGDPTFILIEICDKANYNSLVSGLADDPWISKVCHRDALVRDIFKVSD